MKMISNYFFLALQIKLSRLLWKIDKIFTIQYFLLLFVLDKVAALNQYKIVNQYKKHRNLPTLQTTNQTTSTINVDHRQNMNTVFVRKGQLPITLQTHDLPNYLSR